jgi:hypothetical protein
MLVLFFPPVSNYWILTSSGREWAAAPVAFRHFQFEMSRMCQTYPDVGQLKIVDARQKMMTTNYRKSNSQIHVEPQTEFGCLYHPLIKNIQE